MRWIVTFKDGSRYVKDGNPPLSDIRGGTTFNEIEWLSLQYGGKQYNVKVPECIVSIDDCRFAYADVRPVENIEPVCMYRANATLRMNDDGKAREGEVRFMALGCRGNTSDGRYVEVCLRVYPDGRVMVHTERFPGECPAPAETRP